MCGEPVMAPRIARFLLQRCKSVAPCAGVFKGEERMSRRALGCAVAALAMAVGGAGSAQAQETRAALDPALVQGRGASVPFAEQEAENAATTGERLSKSATG